MSRSDRARLDDIRLAAAAIAEYLERGPIDDPLVFDAVRIRLVEIGEAVKDVDATVLGAAPEVPWRAIARMRDHLTHRYFDTSHQIVRATVRSDLPSLILAVDRLIELLEQGE